MKKLVPLFFLIISSFFFSTTSEAVLITFDEVAGETILNGTKIGAASFSYTPPLIFPTEAKIIPRGGVAPRFIPNTVGGDARGIFQIEFDNPVISLAYDYALGIAGFGDGGTTLTTYDKNMKIIAMFTDTNTTNLPGGIGKLGRLDYAGTTPFKKAEFIFLNFESVIFDNLEYEFSATTVPEPTTMALIGLGLAGAGFLRCKKK